MNSIKITVCYLNSYNHINTEILEAITGTIIKEKITYNKTNTIDREKLLQLLYIILPENQWNILF